MQSEANDAIVDGNQLAVAAMGFQIGPHRFDPAQHPGLDVVGMQRMQQEHARDEVILQGFVEYAFASGGLDALIDEPLKRRTVQLDNGLHELERGGPDLRIVRLIELAASISTRSVCAVNWLRGLGSICFAGGRDAIGSLTAAIYSCPATRTSGEGLTSMILPSPTNM